MSSALMKLRFHFVVALLLPLQASGCTFPSDLTGDWMTSSRSTLTFTSTTFTPWTVGTVGTFTFTCLQNNGSIYISRSNSFSYIGHTWYAYLCMDLNAINTNAYYYNLGSTAISNGKVKLFVDGSPITQDTICDSTNYDTGTYEVMVKSGAAPSAAADCSASLQATWMYSFDAGSGDTCSSGSYLDVCTSTSMMTFNYTSCSTSVAYSASGSLYCIYNMTSGSNTYLTLYNDDTSTDESTTYRFTCMVITTSGSSVYVTQYPQNCQASQNSTLIASPGAALVLQNSTSCPSGITTTPTPTTTAAPTSTTETPVSNGMAVGLGVTFALVAVMLAAAVLIWCYWSKKKKTQEKTRGDKDLEGATVVKEMDKDEKDEDKVEQTIVDRIDGGYVPPDVLPRETPVSPVGENGRPTTSGSIHVCLPSGDESERDDKSVELIAEEVPNQTSAYHVVGVHPGLEETDSGSETTPVKTFAPQKAIVPKGAVALGNGVKPRPKVGKRTLPPIVEDTTPRSVNTPRGSIHSVHSVRRKFGQKGTVGIQETTTESGSDDLPGQPDRRGPVKLRQMRMQRGAKKPGQDKPERRVRTRSNKDHKDTSVDDEDYIPPSTPVKVTRVDITSLAKEKPKKSPRNKRSDLKVVDMDDDFQKHVSSPEIRGLSPEPSYTPTSSHLRGYVPEVTSIAHAAPVGRAPSPERTTMLRDKPRSSASRRSMRNDYVDGVRFETDRPRSAMISRSTSMVDGKPGGRVYPGDMQSPVSPDAVYGTRRSTSEADDRPRSRSRSRGRKRRKSLARSRSEVRPMSAPALIPRSITLDVEEIPQDSNNPNSKVLAARSLAIDMEQVDVNDIDPPYEKIGTKRGKDVRPKSRPRARAKTAVSRSSAAADDDRSLRFWVFFARPIILLTRKFQPSSFMRRREAIADDMVEESRRSPRRASNVSSINRRHPQPVQIEFGTSNMSRIRELD